MAGSEYDVIVAGGGLAGLTAGLFSARCGRSTLVLVPGAPGGPLLNIDAIEDFPGFPGGIAGYELCPLVQEQAEKHGADVRMAEIERLEASDAGWAVTADGEYRTRAVVVATGTRGRALGVPGEERLQGSGVSHCAGCDGPLFAGRTVGVVGGGDSALQEALALAEHAAGVIVFHRGEVLSAQETYRRRVEDHPAISVRLQTVVDEILGDGAVRGVRARDAVAGEAAEVELAAVFVYVGREPETAFLHGLLTLDGDGRIPTDVSLRTELPGLFAAGDVRSGSAGQAITSAGDGAAAALAADRYLAEQQATVLAADRSR